MNEVRRGQTVSSRAARLGWGLHVRTNYVDRGCAQVLYPLAEVLALAVSWGVVEDKGNQVSPVLLARFYILAIQFYSPNFRNRGGLFSRAVQRKVEPKSDP